MPAMPGDIEVFPDRESRARRVGTLRRHARRGREAITFEYHADLLQDPAAFSLEPALAQGRGAFAAASARSKASTHSRSSELAQPTMLKSCTVALLAASWRDVAARLGARPPGIRRMESAFEHEDLRKLLAF
jgi:hypothetical protein